ncbi:C40 family peptidase [Frankia sp. R82]|nr:C40 family peptidase [Frankia sp. R82]
MGLTGLLLAGPTMLAGSIGTAWASPAGSSSTSLDGVQAEIDQASAELDTQARQAAQTAEQFNAERIRLAAAEQAAAAAAGRVVRADRVVRTAADRHRGLAVSAGRAGGFNELSLLFSGDLQHALDRVGAVNALATRQRNSDTVLRLARRDLTEARQDADAALADKKEIVADLGRRKQELEASADTQRRLLDRLQARYAELKRQALAQAEAARRARQAAAAAAAAALARQAQEAQSRYQKAVGIATTAGQAFAATPIAAAPAQPALGSGGAPVAVQEAYAQLGKPYVWGADGPGTFDCSGLSQWVWRKAGVALSHYTGSQWNEGKRVSRAELIPGDLVFFNPDLDHVGIYVGGDQMIDAPHTGEVVRVENIWPSFQGGVRPGA